MSHVKLMTKHEVFWSHHREFVAEHDRFVAETETWRREQRERDAPLDARLDKLVSGLGHSLSDAKKRGSKTTELRHRGPGEQRREITLDKLAVDANAVLTERHVY